MTLPTHGQLVRLTVLGSLVLFSAAAPARGQAGDPALGKKLFSRLGCVACHTVRGQGGGGEVKAPELADLYGTIVELKDGTKVEVTEAYLRQSMMEPDARVVKGYPEGKMPKNFSHLPEPWLAGLVAYIKGLSEKGRSESGAASAASGEAAHEHAGAEAGARAPAVGAWILVGFFGGIVFSTSVVYMARKTSWQRIVMIVAIPVVGMGTGAAWASLSAGDPSEKTFQVTARQFAYDPPIIRVNRGDRVTLTLKSKDVLHGFYLDGYGINKEIRPDQTVQFSFVADIPGRFSYRCSRTCGVFHPFMIGNLIVEPNYLFPGSIGLCFGLGLATFVYIGRKEA